jgi:hypothetical protein
VSKRSSSRSRASGSLGMVICGAGSAAGRGVGRVAATGSGGATFAAVGSGTSVARAAEGAAGAEVSGGRTSTVPQEPQNLLVLGLRSPQLAQKTGFSAVSLIEGIYSTSSSSMGSTSWSREAKNNASSSSSSSSSSSASTSQAFCGVSGSTVPGIGGRAPLG